MHAPLNEAILKKRCCWCRTILLRRPEAGARWPEAARTSGGRVGSADPDDAAPIPTASVGSRWGPKTS
jgi:hypothetical protein